MLNFSLSILDRLQNCWDQITEAQAGQLQDNLGIAFPDDYRQFLLRFNAGDWAHGVWIHVPGLAPDYDRFHITRHFGVVPNKRFWSHDMQAMHDQFSAEVPDVYLAVMSGHGGMICLRRHGQDQGSVHFWDMQRCRCREDFMFPIADSFTEFLLGLNPDDDEESYRETLPAFQACERGDKQAVGQYLADGGKVDLRNERGETLTACAAFNSWPKIVGLLLEAGADPNARDALQRSPLHQAALSSSLDSAKLLLAAGADAHYRDAAGHNLADIAKDAHQSRVQLFFEPLV